MTPELLATLANELLLVDRAKADPKAFAEIYDFYFARVYNYARYRVMDPTAADDLTSEIFERVLGSLNTFRPERGPFSAWLFAIARNTVNYNLRRQKVRRWVSLDRLPHRASVELKPDESVVQRETRAEMLRAIGELNERERELIALKFFAGLANRSIARLTGLKESHVGVILHRAIKRMRAILDDEEVSK